MQPKYLTAVPLIAGACLAQTGVPTCGFIGWDTGVNIAYYAAASTANYASCSALCDANTACLSFSYNAAAPDCILYGYAVEGNDVADANSPNTFFNRGGTCPTITTTTTTTSTTSTAPTTTATPTCTGFVGWDDGTNIAFYADAASATYSGCLALCDANSACLSFGLTSAPACILYDHVVEGRDIAGANTGNTFYDRGGACPATSVAATTTSATAVPTQTGAFANAGIVETRLTTDNQCPSGILPYNVNNLVTPYSPCNSNYPSSSCMSDVDGTNYCNLCLACTTATCASDADCETGYACIRDSDCPINGETNGTAVCLYMSAGGSAQGCLDSLA